MKNHERRAIFCVFRSSLASETLFLVIFDEKPWATGYFLRFSLIACKRNVVFGIFRWKITSDEWFSAFLVFPLRGKVSSRCYFVFPRGGNPSFADFWFSSAREIRFSLFFRFHPRMTGVFCLFFAFIHGWRMIFAVFSFSSTDEECFSAFSWFHPWMTGNFSRKPMNYPISEPFFLFFVHPRGRTGSFSCFLFIRGLGQLFFSIFCQSEVSGGPKTVRLMPDAKENEEFAGDWKQSPHAANDVKRGAEWFPQKRSGRVSAAVVGEPFSCAAAC